MYESHESLEARALFVAIQCEWTWQEIWSTIWEKNALPAKKRSRKTVRNATLSKDYTRKLLDTPLAETDE